MVLKEGKVPRVLISEVAMKQVEYPSTMDTQGSLPGLLDLARGRGGNGIGDGHPPPPISPLPADGIAFYQALADLQQEADLVTLSSSLLGVNSQEREFLPVYNLT